MTRLNELIEIDRRFQNSINLQLDLKNEEKINKYIPTRSSNEILEHYLNNVEENKEKATILIGPYGKGKSHLLLVLLDKLSKRKDKYLTVIVSGAYNDLLQAFTLGLIDALKREGLEDIIPDSSYKRAKDVIENWRLSYPDAYSMFLSKIESYAYKEDSFNRDLEHCDNKAYEVFKSIYSEMTYGGEFNPLVDEDIKTLYSSVAEKLASEYGYGGIFIVFDEFSKYIEGHEVETFEKDMSILQDMCECANLSKNAQIHIVFVAHKSIKEYGNALPKSKINAFTGVEGRIKEVRFIVSSQNNYELIQYAIKKKHDISKFIPQRAIDSYALQGFNTLFSEDDFNKIIVTGCYPLMPLTAAILLQISEKVAQNERSVFTYLANDEKGTLYNHVISSKEKKDFVVTVDTVYDYFTNLFREDTTQAGIHAEWLKADYALSKCDVIEERKLIKVIALLLMLRKSDELPVNAKVLSFALNMEQGHCEKLLDSLVSKKMIMFKPQTKAYVFKNNVGVDIEKEISEVMAKITSRVDYAGMIASVSELDYIMPKKHNQTYRITRYFQYVYMTEKQFLSLPDAETLFNQKFADGKIITIIRTEECTDEINTEIADKCNALADKRIVVLLPKEEFKATEKLRKLCAVRTLMTDTAFIEDNVVLEQELHIYEEDIVYELNQEIQRSLDVVHKKCSVLYMSSVVDVIAVHNSLNDFISTICNEYYSEAPKVNNELINRQEISSQNRKARHKIIDLILSESDCSELEHGTSPEATIYRATMLHTGIHDDGIAVDQGCQKALDIIEAFIKNCDGNRQSLDLLYDSLMGRDIGARKGIIPIYIAYVIAHMQDMPILYLEDKEIDIEAGIFDNIENEPHQYYVYVEHGTAAKEAYLKKLESLFVEDIRMNKTKRKRLNHILEGIQDWYRSLPQVTLNTMVVPDDMNEEDFKKVKAFRKIFRQMELNPRDVLFDKIYKIADVADYEKTGELVEFIKIRMSRYFDQLRSRACKVIKEEFKIKKNESLSAGLKSWYGNQSDTAKTYLSGNKVTNFLNYIAHLSTNDENDITERIVRIVLDVYLEDWSDKSLEAFQSELKKVHMEIDAIDEKNYETDKSNHIVVSHGAEKIEKYYENMEEDSTSYFFKNAIDEALEEFGDTLEMNQKVSVLVQTLEKLINMQ